jgi:nucleoside phosphorylase
MLLSASRPGRDQQNEKPDAAIVIGVCGGLTDLLPETTIVTYSSCLSAMNEGIVCSCSPQLSAQITALLNAQNVPCRSVIGITSPRVAITKDDKLRLARSGAQVVDMESYHILMAAQECGVPAAVVRVVSDSLDRRLPDFNRALNPDGSVNNGKALRVMLGSPLLTARAFTANKRAARHLANALSVVLSADFPCFQ